ncbi:MAG TPA: DUF4292 domain-containing protein [Flammeovirgaceae bacterium]|nr:DUF4292 domain-containing protein [Flammeovirgaceae bacterium]
MIRKLPNGKSFSKALLVLLASILLLSGCKSKFALFTKTYDRESLKIQQLDFNYLVIKSKIELREPHKTTKVTALVRLKKDSIIWFNLSGALGVQGIRGIITQDSVFIINRVEKSFNAYSFADVSREFNFPIDFALIQSMIVGNMPKPDEPDQAVKHEHGRYVVRQRINNVRIDNYIDDENMKLVEVQVTEVDTDNALKLLYKDFRVINQQAFPFSAFISLIHHNEFGQLETQMTIDHMKVEAPDKPLKFPFNIPAKYVKK